MLWIFANVAFVYLGVALSLLMYQALGVDWPIFVPEASTLFIPKKIFVLLPIGWMASFITPLGWMNLFGLFYAVWVRRLKALYFTMFGAVFYGFLFPGLIRGIVISS